MADVAVRSVKTRAIRGEEPESVQGAVICPGQGVELIGRGIASDGRTKRSSGGGGDGPGPPLAPDVRGAQRRGQRRHNEEYARPDARLVLRARNSSERA